MAERVVPRLDGLEWEPNVPGVVVIAGDGGPACVAMRAHFADPDQRAVALVWQRCSALMTGSPMMRSSISTASMTLASGICVGLVRFSTAPGSAA